MKTLFSQDWHDYVHAPKIEECYPKVATVHIRLERSLSSNTALTFDLRPDDPVHLSIECLNPDCTSKFILTSILEEALKRETLKQGTLFCSGRESSRPGAYSCSCSLGYLIEPIMRE